MEPKIAQKGPYVLDLKPGTYWWCCLLYTSDAADE